MRFTKRFLERFRQRLMNGIRIDEETGCWVWERYTEFESPPRIQINRVFGGESYHRRRHYQVNYMVYQLVVDDLPEEPFRFAKKPTCYYRNRCVNPYHSDIRLVTPRGIRLTPEALESVKKSFGLSVIIDLSTGCWSYPGTFVRARLHSQEVSWLLYRGELSEKARIQAMCKTSGCCNPLHITLRYPSVLVDLIDSTPD